MEIVYRVVERPLPQVVTDSHYVDALDESDLFGFKARLRYIEEICLKADEWLQTEEKQSELAAFLNRMELDLAINLGLPQEASGQVSWWLVHTSWTFETSTSMMARTLSPALIAKLEDHPPGLTCEMSELAVWLRGQSLLLRALLDQFYEAVSYDAAIAALIAVDICLSNLLVGILRQRLNTRLEMS